MWEDCWRLRRKYWGEREGDKCCGLRERKKNRQTDRNRSKRKVEKEGTKKKGREETPEEGKKCEMEKGGRNMIQKD